MKTATAMYALGLDEAVKLILSVGHKRTILLQGHMGCGKSSSLGMLSQELPDYDALYFDCATKDLGDITVPNIAKLDDGSGYVTYLTNEELGAHLDKPVIVMLDEFGKSNPAVKNALLRFMLERKIGSYTLHPDSIVYATTNMGSEGVGDLLLPHQCDRLVPVKIRKPQNMEWIEWGINNDIDHTLLGFAKDNPQIFYSFEDVKDPDDNPYIFHPKQNRAAFITPRSLEAASDILKARHLMDDQTTTAALMGAIGERGAMDLMAFVKLADQIPSAESIKQDPKNAKIPSSAAGVCMVVFRTLASIEADWINPWMDYLVRLDKEAQGMFANGVRAPKYAKQSLVMTNKKFTQWAMDNNYMFAADKK